MRTYILAPLPFLLNPNVPRGPKLLGLVMLAHSDTGKYDGICQIGLKTLALHTRTDWQTVLKWVKWLETNKYIERISPLSSGAATIYKVRIP